MHSSFQLQSYDLTSVYLEIYCVTLFSLQVIDSIGRCHVLYHGALNLSSRQLLPWLGDPKTIISFIQQEHRLDLLNWKLYQFGASQSSFSFHRAAIPTLRFKYR